MFAFTPIFALLCASTQPTASTAVPGFGTQTDAEFDAALPPLDSVAPSTEVQPPPAPPSVDPELEKPLTPLSEFDVRAPDAQLNSNPHEDRGAVRYTVRVEGLEGLGLRSRFEDLSALYANRRAPAARSQIAARVEADVELLQRLMRSEGFYDGRVDPAMSPAAEEDGLLNVVLNVASGKRYHIDEIVVTGPPTHPEGLAREVLPLKVGDPLRAEDVIAAEAKVRLRLPQQGYPFTEVGPRDVLLKEAQALADYTLKVDPGPRSSFGSPQIDGDRVFAPSHVQTIARFQQGELYDERLVDDLRRALVATGLFSTVAVEPVRTGRPGPDRTEQVDLRLRSEAAPFRTVALSAGYGSGEGARAEASWTHRNLFPPEGALTFRALAGTQEQRVSANFRRSNAGQRDRTFQMQAEASRERREDSFDATALTLSARISRESTPIWRKRWTYALGAELATSSERARRDVPTETYYLAALPLQLGYDRSNDLLDPTRGFRIVGRTSPEISFNGGTTPYLRSFVDASAYHPVSDSLVLAARTRVANIVGADRADIAPSRRLYGGGGGSVRGYGYRELGPIAANGERVGGRSLAEFSLEARYRFGNFGVVPFVDVGQAYESTFPKFTDLRFGVGIGARYYTNFGPVRIDLARALNRREGDPKLALYISIGQAF